PSFTGRGGGNPFSVRSRGSQRPLGRRVAPQFGCGAGNLCPRHPFRARQWRQRVRKGGRSKVDLRPGPRHNAIELREDVDMSITDRRTLMQTAAAALPLLATANGAFAQPAKTGSRAAANPPPVTRILAHYLVS